MSDREVTADGRTRSKTNESSYLRTYFVVDAFTDAPCRGNPAAVVILDENDHLKINDSQLQKIAFEINLSETVFVRSMTEEEKGIITDGEPVRTNNIYHIRWFTPSKEVQLCGHATLGAAHAITEGIQNLSESHPSMIDSAVMNYINKKIDNQNSQIHFFSHIAKHLYVDLIKREEVSEARIYQLRFPLRKPESIIESLSEEFLCKLAMAFGLSMDAVYDVALHKSSQKYLLVLKDPKYVINAQVDHIMLRAAMELSPHVAPLSVTLTALVVDGSDECRIPVNTDIVSRHFAQWVGIDEDPVTGAAHVVLVPYWLQVRFVKGRDNKESVLRCFQAFPQRGGILECRILNENTVGLTGRATTFSFGRLIIPG
eukprot:Tbor_TRINITY_DN6021_c3_g3::TRINITY_DN6021_c3_g3_i1::g.11145::m.11145